LGWKSKEYWTALGLIVGFGVYAGIVRSTTPLAGKRPDLSRIPLVVGSWRGEEQPIGEAIDDILRADESLYVRYVHPSGELIWLFVGYFQNQKYGSQIHSPKNCLPGGGWKILSQKRLRLSSPDMGPGEGIPMTYLLISNGRERDVMLYWFETRRGKIANEFYLKFDILINSLLFQPSSAAFIRFNIPLVDDNPEKSLELLKTLIHRLHPAIEQAMAGSGIGQKS